MDMPAKDRFTLDMPLPIGIDMPTSSLLVGHASVTHIDTTDTTISNVVESILETGA